MRGKESFNGRFCDSRGITPAYAGKRMQCNQAILHVWDHPRLCGEKASCSSQKQQTIGSPPPMRGKDGAITVVWEYFRITPAYAGKRQACPHTCGSRWDHPRLCGEKQVRKASCTAVLGSPPPMRGKVLLGFRCRFLRRITPAYAGKSSFEQFRIFCVKGSPPPMRGKANALPSFKLVARITPAYAGKSQYFSLR